MLADLLFPHITATPDDLERKYPPRKLPEGACVTRIAPSPTGYLHIGALYGSLVDMLLARQSNGVFYLRIEDTDDKRKVANGEALLINGLADFGIEFDEGAVTDGDNGAYGPYRQRQRKEIYQTIAKQLVRQGHAYPCFCTEEDLTAKRERQTAQKLNPGYYGEWATHRNCDSETIKAELAAGKQWVLRLRSPGDARKSVAFRDEIRGDISFPENEQDIVLLKSDGIPTYHFAHVVDDHFMRTTHVIRGDEWLASLPIHYQLFDLLGFQRPKYAHTAIIVKHDETTGGKRKISKRKDPEADVQYYRRHGYPNRAVLEYLLTLINSSYEEWRAANPALDAFDFALELDKLSKSAALFDFAKLNDISKNIISRLTADEAYTQLLAWAQAFAPDFAALLTQDSAQSRAMLSIGRGGDKPRKDITVWSDAPAYLDFFFDETFARHDAFPDKIDAQTRQAILRDYVKQIDLTLDNQAWFDQIKVQAVQQGFTTDNKAYKADPTAYKGTVGDFVMVLRVAVCGRQNAPDLYSVMQILGRERVSERLTRAAEGE